MTDGGNTIGMPDCRYCGTSGWLFALNPTGLCGSCEHLVSADIEARAQVLKESRQAADDTRNTETKLERLGLAVAQLEALARYERKGIRTPIQSPERSLKEAQRERDALVMRAAKEDLDAAMKDLKTEGDPESKVRRLNALRLRLKDYEAQASSKGPLPALGKRLQAAAWRVRLSAALERAGRFEAAGDREQAVRAYREALTLLCAPEASGPVLIDQRLHVSERLAVLGPGA